jgi:16S rRNA C967 or C1407 C5-methylase (RsmB/RsmF family)/NOL1/NOP2/fmu family ribosome biogenesis protein
MLPEEFLERISRQNYIDAGRLAEALGQPSPVSVRINPYKWTCPVTGYDRVIWEPQGYYLQGRPLFTADPLFHAGVYYPQEASSMFTGEVFRQVTTSMNNIRVLDLCGAPGGKSTHLSALMAGNGLLIANEVIRSRAAVLVENITKWGIGNTIVTQNDPSAFAALTGFFDVIVADAPCSGEGMFRDSIAVAEWSQQNARLCSERQRRIVMDVWPALKPGGMMIYSTCTFNPAENEENISWFRDTTRSEPVFVDISGMGGVTRVRYREIEGYGFYPGKIKGDGFFIAVLRKPLEMKASTRNIITKAVKKSARAFEIVEPLMTYDRDRLVMSGNMIMALAAGRDIFSYISANLTVIKSGTLVGEMMNDSFIPAHDLAMSVWQKDDAWISYDASYDEAVTYLRRGQLRAARMPVGRIRMRYRGVPLGFVNNIGSRVNNGYPKAWRMRMEKQSGFSSIL